MFGKKLTAITEMSFSSPDRIKIDREAGVIKDVKILGPESANGRTYTRQAMQEAARLYEGVDVNLDHPEKSPSANRKISEGFGVLRNVREGSDGVYGDLHYLKTHPLAEMVAERAGRFPENVGLSHNADARVVTKGGKQIVESVAKVRSVDLVRNPATNRSLFESENDVETIPLSEFIRGIPKGTQYKPLFEAAVAQYPQMGQAQMPMLPGQQQEMGGAIHAAIKSLLAALADDGSIPPETILQLLKDHLMPGDKEQQSDQNADQEGDKKPPFAKEKEDVEESTQETRDEQLSALTEQVATLNKRAIARDILDELSVTGRPDLLKELLEQKDEEAMRARAKTWAPSVLRRPKPVMEARHALPEGYAIPKTGKEFAKAIR